MFSYYGSKGKIAKLYPPPAHGHIIEPFAGSARYAMLYPDREVTLVDKFHKIVAVWRYLRQASTADILSLPDIEPNDDLRNHTQLSDAERWFIGFQLNGGTSDTRYKVTGTGTFNRWRTGKKRIAEDVNKIRHWNIVHGDFQCLANVEATWYVDPPYQFGGQEYKHPFKKLDVVELAQFCTSRRGQVIVCENTKANWLPFRPLVEHRGSNFTTTEAIWLSGVDKPTIKPTPNYQNKLF